MDQDRIRDDVEFLAGRLAHRGANTENERTAAEYICDRLKESCPGANIEDCYSVDSWQHLFALYYFDFVFVAVIAIWFPWVGLTYGLTVFALYIAEFTGFQTMGRFLPQYETQNIAAEIWGALPHRLLVVTAHYDSPKYSSFSESKVWRSVRWLHIGVILIMVGILISCAMQGIAESNGATESGWNTLRWFLAAGLACVGMGLYFMESQSEFSRGANDNATGTAVLLSLAASLTKNPLQTTNVLLVATGAKGGWFGGMQALMRTQDFERHDTFFLNLDSLGAGDLGYTKREGLMHAFGTSKVLRAIAKNAAPEYNASQFTYRGWPTDALIPLARGYNAMTVMARDSDGLPPHSGTSEDRADAVDYYTLSDASAFVEEIVRSLDRLGVQH